jgi:hypothetical protein
VREIEPSDETPTESAHAPSGPVGVADACSYGQDASAAIIA